MAANRRRGGGGRRKRSRDPRPVEWEPKTKLGRYVKGGKITTMHDALHSGLAIREPQIIDILLPELSDEVLDVNMVQRMTDSGRRVKFVITVVVGNGQGYFCHVQGRSGICTGENYVFHRFTPQLFDALLTHDPAQCINDIAFATAVGIVPNGLGANQPRIAYTTAAHAPAHAN